MEQADAAAKKPMSSLKVIGLIIAGIIALAIVAEIIHPTPQAGTSPATSPSATASPSAPPVAETKPSPAAMQDAVKQLFREVSSAVDRCDRRAKKLADVAAGLSNGSTSVYDGYSAASEVVDACRASDGELNAIKVPDTLPSKAQEAATKMIDDCRTAVVSKQMAGDTAMEIFDGEMKPSKVQEFKEQAGAGQAGSLICVAGMFSVAHESGVEFDKVKDAIGGGS